MDFNRLFLEKQYALSIAGLLEQSKVVRHNPFLLKFRCNICGDSKTNRYKTRAYFYEKANHLSFKCHNCGESITFNNYLKDYFPSQYSEMRMELLKENKDYVKKEDDVDLFQRIKEQIDKHKYLEQLIPLSQLDDEHIAIKYIKSRKIYNECKNLFYHTDSFFTYINSYIPGKFPKEIMPYDEPRLIIPLKTKDGFVFGVQGRSYKKDSKLRYITILFDDTQVKMFGLERVNENRDIYVLEGCIDSLLIKNAVAVCHSDLTTALNYYTQDKCVFIPDKNTRNLEVMQQTKNMVDAGLRVCFLPENLPGKDINQFIENGITKDQLEIIIKNNTFQGLKAKLHFTEWCKIKI